MGLTDFHRTNSHTYIYIYVPAGAEKNRKADCFARIYTENF